MATDVPADDGGHCPDNFDHRTLSNYALGLNQVAQKRYTEKLCVENGAVVLPDPYHLGSDEWTEDIRKWPNVQYGDVYNYLVNTPGVYTKEALKCYKSLDGYNFFISGHVQTVFYHPVSDDSPVCLLKANVRASQKQSAEYRPWVCVDKKTGYVITAHCTCKAG